jgi:ATP-dependent helicase/nuclease subunit B
MIKLLSDLIRQGVTPVFDTRHKANRVEYLLARHQGLHVARSGLVPSAVAGKLGESLAGPAADRTLLSDRQALLLWEEAIVQSHRTDALLDSRIVARWAREAAALAGDYRIPMGRLAAEPAAESAAVTSWWRTVSQLQTANGWLDPRGLLAAADSAVQSGHLGVKHCAWLDRDLSHPVALGLARQMHLTVANPVELALEQTIVTVCPDPMEELRAAAAWAYETVAKGTKGQVAVVVPGLAARIQDVHQAFADLAPVGTPAPFTLAGTPLIGLTSVRAAVALVELVLGNRSFAVASAVLRALHLFRGQELTGRASLERRLREHPDGQVWLLSAAGLGAFDRNQPETTKHFAAALERLSRARPRPGHTATPMQWADDIRGWLRLAGWQSGAANLDLVWNEVLMRLASLGFNGAKFTSSALLEALRREIAEARVPAEMGPIEILGRIDDVGLGCDHVWVTGMAETQYPHLPKPNPMLPLGLQRQWGIPGASPQTRSRHASGALARVRGLAKEVRLSFPRSQGDVPNSIHPVLAGWPQRSITAPTLGRTRTLLGQTRADFCDDPVPVLGVTLKGGASRALAWQARCPAIAFFEFRLGAERLEQPQAGVRPQDQGRWAHQICERLFERLTDSEILQATTESVRADMVAELVDEVLRVPLSRAHGAYRAALEVEHRLLQRRMLVLLEQESQRGGFQVVEREARRQQQIGPMKVTVRLDRIDRLGSGELAVVDYKTGKTPKLKHWLQSPLRDTQLPLYALMAGATVGAALFAQIGTQVAHYQGIWPSGTFPTRSAPSPGWHDLKAFWQRELERLAEEFVTGQGWLGNEPEALEGPWAPLSRIYAGSDRIVDVHDL